MCVLCKDTFSRSDILKRHFQKCSLRRGNPTGASHLSHSQAYLKRSQNSLPGAYDSSTAAENSAYLDAFSGPLDDQMMGDTTGIGSTDLTTSSTTYSEGQQSLHRSNSDKQSGIGQVRSRHYPIRPESVASASIPAFITCLL